MKKILFIVMYESEKSIYGQCASHFSASGVADQFEFHRLFVHRYLWNPKDSENNFLLEDYISHVPCSDAVGRIRAIENQYDIPSIRRFYLADPLMEGIGHETAIDIVRKYFDAWELVFDKHHFDFVILFDGGEVAKRVLHAVVKKRNIGIFLDFGVLFPGRMIWATNEVGKIHNFKRYDHSQLSGAEIEEMRTYLNSIVSSRQNFTLFLPFRLRKKNFLMLWHRGRARMLYDRWNYRFRLGFYIKRGLQRILRSYVECFLHCEAKEGTEKFVLFPLHNHYDTQVTIRAPHLEQENLIRIIANSLPADHVLYVKEHPSFIGGYSLSFLYRISRMPNVRLINPYVHPHKLLPKATAVIVLNSTTGFEAIAFDTPLITLAKSFYRGQGLSYDLDNLENLPEILREILKKGVPYRQEEKEAFLCSLKRCTLSGPLQHPMLQPTAENIQGYARSILEVIENRPPGHFFRSK